MTFENDFDTALNFERKYEFFFTGLIFAIVGLAVQTASPGLNFIIVLS